MAKAKAKPMNKSTAKPTAMPPRKPVKAKAAKAKVALEAKAKVRAKAKLGQRSKTKVTAKAKPSKPAAKTAAKTAAKSKSKLQAPTAKSATKAQPARKPAKPAKPKSRAAADAPDAPHKAITGGGEVVRILDADDPIAALRAFLHKIPAGATPQQGEIALGAAQLLLLPIAREHRGGPEVKQLLDLVLGRWSSFPERTGFHAQEFLRNAFAAIGDDRERIARLTALVPLDASPELRFNVACALAVAGDRDAMMRATDAALSSGVSAAQFRRDEDFAPYLDDPQFQALLDRSAAPAIPVDIARYFGSVRASLDSAVRTLREFGEVAKLEPPATLDAVLAAERARKIQLPNDFRALLTICDGMTLWDHVFFGTVDYRNDTDLAKSARAYLESSVSLGATGLDECVPLANWGQPNDWLLYDPHGRFRGGTPGYLLMLNADECPLDGLSHALDRFERIARDVLGTN
ncbi:MAG: SMI1/KNR4 family protein [Deltaproteobacteria bacterium]|nr:SMI1/KNR4 family protein [Deltaproteobacteria bacterium]